MRFLLLLVVCSFGSAPLGAATSVIVSANPNSVVFGAPVRLTATVQGCAPPSGARVAFYDGVTHLGNWVLGSAAPLTTVTLAAGTRRLRAYYPGDASCAAASSPSVSVNVAAVASNYFNFRPGYTFTSPQMTAAGDFDGDGRLDLAVANNSSVGILLNNPAGGFTNKGSYVTTFIASTIAVGDWNRDGRSDLAISGGGYTAVMMGNGDGSFQPPLPIWSGSGSLAVADFNGDGSADIAVSSSSSNVVAIIRSMGDGNFLPAVTYPAGAAPGAIAVGDFNRDGKADVVVVNPATQSISVLLGNGDGSLQAPVTCAASSFTNSPRAVAVGDFNGDGADDIATAAPMTVFLSKGDGSFQPGVWYHGLADANSLVAVDVNGDGILDLATVDDDTDEQRLGVFSGNGDGTFQLGWYQYPGWARPHMITAGGFNALGRVDLAITSSGRVYVDAGVTANLVLNSPLSAPAGAPFPEPVQVRVIDSSGLPIPGVQVNGDVGGIWGFTDSSGLVSKTMSANTTPGLYFLNLSIQGPPTDGSGLAGSFGTAQFVLESTAPPSSLQAATGAQATEVGTRFIRPLGVRLTKVAGVTVTFTTPASGASATLSSATAVTDQDGYASVTAVANGLIGGYTVTATAGGFTATFPLTNTARTIAGCWTFDAADAVGKQAIDCSGNGLTGTISGATPTAGAIKEALSFNGGGFVTVPDSAATDLTHDLTLAVWVKSTNTTQKQNLLSKYDFSGAESGYLLQLLPAGSVNLRLGGNNLAFGTRDAADATVVNDGKWHHVAAVIALGRNVAFYIDGRLRSTQAVGAIASRTTSPLYIGSLPGSYNGSPFVGALDDPRIYSRALTPAEVAALLGFPVITGIDPASVPSGRPAVITINGAGFVPSSVVIEPDALSGPELSISIVPTTYVSPTQLTATLSLDFTVGQTLRFQVFNASQDIHSPSGYPLGPGSNIVRYVVDTLMPEVASISPYWTSAGGSDFVLTVRGANFAQDCACVSEPIPGARVYWNGSPLQSTGGNSAQLTALVPASFIATPGTANITVVNPVGIVSRNLRFTITSGAPQLSLSCIPSSGPTLVGSLYSATCTATGGVAPYTLAASAGLPPNLSVTATTATSITVGGVPRTAGPYTYSISAHDNSAPWQWVTLSFTGTLAAAPPPSPPPPPPPPVSTAVACWSFDTSDISGNQGLDRCGSGSNGTIVNAAPITGRVNQALQFSGAGSYVSVPDNVGLQLSHDLTVAAWIQTTNNSQKQNFVSKYDFSGSEYGYMLQVLPAGVVNLRLGGNSVSGATRDFADTKPINDGQWHHVAVVSTSLAVSFYIDGQFSSSRPAAKMPSPNWGPLYLGTFPGAYNGLPFTGSLDEVRIFATALSAADIQALVPMAPLSLSCAPPAGPLYLSVPYSQTCTASGGTPPYLLSAAGLPAGLSVTATTATSITIFGSPSNLGPYSYTVHVTDNAAPSPHSASQTVAAEIQPPAPAVLTSLSPPSWTAGTPLTLTVNGTGFLPGSVVVEVDAPSPVHVQQTTFVSSTQLKAKLWEDLTFYGGKTLHFQVFSGGAGSNILPFTVARMSATISSISPASAVAGGPDFTLTVRGMNFFGHCDCNFEIEGGSWIYWNGKAVGNTQFSSDFISSTELRYTIPASLIATAGTATITVDGPPNAGPSNTVTFTISAAPPTPTIAPAAYWTFDSRDVSGYSVLDRSGNGVNGSLVSATVAGTLVPGKVNEAFTFSGVSYVSVPDAVSLQLRHDLALTGWLKVMPLKTADGVVRTQNVISKYDFSGAESGYILQVTPSGALNLHIGRNNLASDGRDAPDTTFVADGQWHHFAVVITLGQNVKFYVDGQLRSTQTQVTTASGCPSVLYMGTFPGAYTGGPMAGSLDEVRIYSMALSAADIAVLAAP